jgi:hypothetical protein
MRISQKLPLLFVPVVVCAVLGCAGSALAAGSDAQWTVSAVSRPTSFAVGSSEDSYVVLVTNTGGSANTETTKEGGGAEETTTFPVTITDELPAGVEALPGTSAEDELLSRSGEGIFSNDCAITGGGGVSCTYDGVVPVDDTLVVDIPVRVIPAELPAAPWPPPCEEAPALALSCVTNVARVEGGGAASASLSTPTGVFADAQQAREATPFGVSPGGARTALSSVQAGVHPDLTTMGAFNTEDALGAAVGSVKDVTDELPAGFAGDLVDTPACQAQLFLEGECPIPTQVGVTTQVVEFEGKSKRELEPVYNLAPEPGEVAKIGFSIGEYFHYEGNIAVRAPGAGGPACAVAVEPTACEPYGLKTTFYNATGGGVDYDGFSLTIWGAPASRVHDPLRWQPQYIIGSKTLGGFFGVSDTSGGAPYFTNPTACASELLRAELRVTSWQEGEAGAAPNPPPTGMSFGPIVGCDRLLMEPSLTAEVTSDAAYSPTGFDLDTSIPQTYDNAAGLATSTLEQEVVTLPEGMTVNPSSGAGLSACSEAQYAEELAPEKTAQEKSEGRGCPNSSKLATVRIKSPSIAEEIVGSAYLAEPAPRGEAGRNPFNSLLALYLVARAANRGVLAKAPGKIEANATTGQLTTTFGPTPAFDEGRIPASAGLPPLPASEITFQFNQGANAPLVTPPTCGNYTVTAELTPWSDPEGSPLDPSIAPFPIDANCPAGNVPPFDPGVAAYPVHANAGAYSPLYLKITRQDGEQEITGFAEQFPAGLTANLTGVEKCSEADVEAARRATGVEEEQHPSCPAGSEIGYSIAEAGVGSVLAQTPGKIYLGEGFEGAPFSVVAITSAHVGPFDLGTVVIHFPLDLNPETAAVTIPSGPSDQIPHIIKGIVIHVRDVRAYIYREKFMLNPTNCSPSALSATVIGGGANPTNPAGYDPVTVADPFQVADCSSLKFEPKFKVSTSAKTSRVDGASLHVALTYPAGALGQDANIKEVKVDLPKQLPSRLPTLQKACTEAQFTANPAGCPAASRIGAATAVTPILPVPLTGPAYFVSNGGAKWPELVMVLQGDGVTIDLHGETFISKAGVTSSTFHAIPDQPVSSFELTLPEGPYSALAALGNLCAAKLAMPTEFTAQNGDVIHQSTPVAVTGCAKTKHTKHKRKKHASKRHARKRGRRGG